MCERDGCSLANITTKTPIFSGAAMNEECKCQSYYYVKMHREEEQHRLQLHEINKEDMDGQRQTQAPQHQQQQQQYPSHPQIHHMNMYSPNNSPNCSDLSTSSLTSDSSSGRLSPSSPSIGVNLRVTGQCSQGGRKYMEDYFSVAYQQSENANDLEYAFIGIFDGHGGGEAATFAKEHLMMEIINQKLFWSDSDRDVLRAIREGYIATHYAMWRVQDKWPKTTNGLPSTAGTTATVAFIRREKIYIGHVGDSGIVLGYQNENDNFWRAKQLTTDHKPESVVESTRIQQAGGKVVVKSGVPRVVWNRPRSGNHKGPIRWNTPVDEIPFLAVARSLGDLWSYNGARNEFIVSPDPDVKVIKINPKTFRCLIFGTDGLWNVVSSKEAVETVQEKESINERLQALRGESPIEGAQWTNPSKSLVEKALKTWSQKKMRADNTSVVTVILYPPGNDTDNSTCNGNVSMQQKSYGLKYAQINAEIPTYNDMTTYQEIVEKYMPPEEYRNFNFYDYDEDKLIKHLPSSDNDIETEQVTYWDRACDKMEEGCDSWAWDSKPEHKDGYVAEITAHDIDGVDETGDEIDDKEDDEDDDDEEDVTEESMDTSNSALNFTQYASDTSTSLDAHVSETRADDEAGEYMNSFAESYNSLLGEQMSQDASSSNSNPSYQSISSSSMHEIMQEQQRYQQQCMSEEEGYSLTKLETRREQQRCSGVQTFKIFQQTQENSTELNYNVLQSISNNESPRFWESRFSTLSGALNKFLAYQQNQQKPLELNSLLQQEREEEQQVALERMEQQRKMADTNTVNECINSVQSKPQSLEVDEETLFEEYLDEEVSLNHDETVQIHEISSSMLETMESNALPATEEQTSTAIAKAKSLHNKRKMSNTTPKIIEKIEKIEILHDKPELVIETPLRTSTPTIQRKLSPLTHSVCNTPMKSMPNSTVNMCYNQTHFRNIPKENQRTTVNSPLKRSRRLAAHLALASAVGNLEKRQLRSSGALVDYAKHTLRSRNSLSKDLKPKASLANLKRVAPVAATHFLNSSVGNFATATARKSTPQHKLTRSANNVNIGDRRPKVEQLTSLTAVANFKHVINLRSRQIYQLQLSSKSPTVTNPTCNINSMVNTHNPATMLCHERRSLRNAGTKSGVANVKEATLNYSKPTTRLQSPVGTLIVSPPTPKLINAAAAVVAVTRARALLTPAKNSMSPVTTEFSKRPTLRSSSSTTGNSSSSSRGFTLPTSNASAAVSTTAPTLLHGTRGRVKRARR